MDFIKAHMHKDSLFLCCNRKQTIMEDLERNKYSVVFDNYGWDKMRIVFDQDDSYLGDKFRTRICKVSMETG